MAERKRFLCEGTWDSSLNGVDDGIFDLDINAQGEITGTHILPDDTELDVTGQCTHTPHHHIEINEERDGVKFQYAGQIIRRQSGKHKTNNGKRKATKRKVDEVWTGVRTT